jgi:protein-tyrosine-phosphatase
LVIVPKDFKLTENHVNILFVCEGNTCRSPFAKGIFMKQVDQRGISGVSSESAGLSALPGNTATFMAQQVAAEHGVDLTAHQAKSASGQLVAWSDSILVMEISHKNSLIREFPEASGKVLLLRQYGRFGSTQRGIADPYGLQYEAYRFCFLDIEDAVTGLVESLLSYV